MKRIITIALVTASAIAPIVMGAQAAGRHRISARQAEAAALRRVHGTASGAKYELEDGRWQYAVIVHRGGAMYEVQVDAHSGKVLDVERTSASEERGEAAADQKAAHGR